jgi:hypothetical protein
VKNVYFYLCYVYLEMMDFSSCLKHGQILLDTYGKELSAKTKFQVLQYLIEACCMLGLTDKAIDFIKESQPLTESDPTMGVETLVNN